tara:strand:- start:8426 stop:8977 length:552 start_codon:yes stop_codon:yes gene_type:complete
MGDILQIIRGLSQAAGSSHDAYETDVEIGLKREKGHPILDARVIDGFMVRFAADKLIVTYSSEMKLEELHPRQQFENEIEQMFGDIIRFLKKEYKNITKNSVTLTPEGEADILVQTTSRIHTWVRAVRQYTIGGLEDVVSVRKISIRSEDKPYEKRFKDFLELSSDKKSPNDQAKKNPDTPEA